MKMRRALAVMFVVVFAVAVVAACGSAESNFNKIEIGMTTDQVRGIMGEPDSKSGIMGAEQWVYKDKYAVQFLGGKVVSKAKQ